MAGIKESAELVDFVVAAVNQGVALASGDQGWIEKARAAMELVQLGPEAFQGIVQVPTELADLDPAEKAILFRKIEALEVPSEQIEVIGEKVLKVLVGLGSVIGDVFTLRVPTVVRSY